MTQAKPIEPLDNFLLDIAPLLLTVIVMMVQFFVFYCF